MTGSAMGSRLECQTICLQTQPSKGRRPTVANNSTGCQALATVKYDDKPFYHGIVIGGPDLKVSRFPDATKGMSISFADVGSTSGWLIPTWYAKEVWKIDPKTFWKYTEGATHAANEVAVQAGQVDLATDFDRNRNAMIAKGVIKPEGTRVVWTSDPLPNDAIVVPRGTSPDLVAHVQHILTALTPEQAATLLPPRYTGFVPATHASYSTIEKAGIARRQDSREGLNEAACPACPSGIGGSGGARVA
jgi:phosphonate transport system substrate-binding protein